MNNLPAIYDSTSLVRGLSQAGEARKAPAAGQADALDKSARDFEGLLTYRLLEEMKRTVPDSELLDSPGGEQVWDLFWSQLAQNIGDQGGMGLWKQFRQQLSGDIPPASVEVLR